jgi:excisionase family DNA binding protein
MALKTRKSAEAILTVNELADYLRVHKTTIYRLLKQNRLPAFRVGSDWRFSQEAIVEWQCKTALPFTSEERMAN